MRHDQSIQNAENQMFEPQEPVGSPAGNSNSAAMAKIDEKPVADLPIEVDVDGNSVAANTAVAEMDAVEAWADEFLAMQPGKDTPDTDVISTVQPAIAGNESDVDP